MSKKDRTIRILQGVGCSLYAVYMICLIYYNTSKAIKYGMSSFEAIVRVIAMITPMCMYLIYKALVKKIKNKPSKEVIK